MDNQITTTFSEKDFHGMEQRFRGAFFNSLGGFKSLTLVGTQSLSGQTNLSVVSSVFHIGANPPLMGMIFRPDSVDRHTLENIMETKCYTFNHVRESYYEAAHQTSARYPRDVSEFEACGLKEYFTSNIAAPYVRDSPIKIGLELAERIDLQINGTVMILGRIVETIVPTDCLTPDGFVDIEMAGSITVSGLDSYHSTTKIGRLPYAKP